MMKRFVLLLLAAVLFCGSAGAVSAGEKEPEWNPRSTWVVYDGELIYPWQQVIGWKPMKFVVEYRRAFGDADGMRCFWLAYVPENANPNEPLIYMALSAEQHDLVFSDDGEYRLLVREPALQEAYELWKSFQ